MVIFLFRLFSKAVKNFKISENIIFDYLLLFVICHFFVDYFPVFAMSSFYGFCFSAICLFPQRCPTHSPHVANGRLNVANGFVSESFENRTFWDKLDICNLIHTFLLKTTQRVSNEMAQDTSCPRDWCTSQGIMHF